MEKRHCNDSCDKGIAKMKVGEVVRFRGKDYRVGPYRTKTSVELVELKEGSRGLWVSRNEIRKVSGSQTTTEQL